MLLRTADVVCLPFDDACKGSQRIELVDDNYCGVCDAFEKNRARSSGTRSAIVRHWKRLATAKAIARRELERLRGSTASLELY